MVVHASADLADVLVQMERDGGYDPHDEDDARKIVEYLRVCLKCDGVACHAQPMLRQMMLPFACPCMSYPYLPVGC
jgi:hypothetical protein